ncbi:TipJ family phage tail tip protein [Teredinibacter purpureus]|uniref:TipJ family phage tail tip protein n=1 Tax=Teredinibacter purpureus TaxID=2731756 RepID=UPI0006986CCC|nr:phage tail protein [Teredinibacter purpureus]
MRLVGAKGGKSGGGSARAAEEDPNTLRSVATARIMDFVSEGEIVGLVDGLKSVFFDGVPVQNEDGSFNFDGVQVDERTGALSQPSVAGFSAVEGEVVVDQEVLQAAPVERTVTDVDIDAVRVKLVIPALTKQDKDDGDLHGYSVQVAVDVQANGGAWVEAIKAKIQGKTTADYERQFRVEKPVGGVPWLFRLRRVSDDHGDDAAIQDQTFFSSYTEIIDAKLSYPSSAYYAVTIDADQFGDKVPKRSYDVRGLIVRVPTNYDPQTREYSGVWDGTFKLAWTDNPAWVLYDLIANDRYGLGAYVDVARINKGSLYQIAQYNDELVDDGMGGQQPRYTFNGQIRTQDEAYTLLRKVASAFRAVNYYGSGTINFAQDAPSDAVGVVMPANVVEGKFRYSSKSLKSRPTAVLTTYSNPADGGRPAIDIWEDSDAVARFGWRQKDIVAFGCDSAGQARRVGRFEVDAGQSVARSVTYRCGLDQLFVRPGDVIGVQDPMVAGLRLGGRVRSVGGLVLTVDSLPSDLPLAYSYVLRYVGADGVLNERAVEGVDVAAGEITVDEALGDVVVGAMWVLSAAEVELPLYRVRSLVRGEGGEYSVEADFYDPSKYARIEQGLVFDNPDFTLLPDGPISVPSNLSFYEVLYRDNAAIKTAVTASVTAPDDSRVGYIQFQYALADEAGWQSGPVDSSPLLELRELRDGQRIRVRARAVSRLGQRSRWLGGDVYEVQGKLVPPTLPASVQAVILPEGGVRLIKEPSPDVDYKETVWRLGGDYESSVELHRSAASEYVWARVVAGSYTLWVVDYDTGGRASEPVSIAVDVAAPAQPVIVHRFEGGDLVLEWSPVASSFAVRHYTLRYDDVVLSETLATHFRAPVNFESARTFTLIAEDVAGNRSAVASVEVQVSPPDQPSVEAVFNAGRLGLSWGDVATDLPVEYYVVDRAGVEVERVVSTACWLSVSWGGSQTLGVTAVDVAGHEGARGSVSVAVVPPSAPVVASVLEGANIRLSWSSGAGSLPVRHYEVWVGGELIETLSAATLLLPVTWSSVKNFEVFAFDTAGNTSDAGVLSVAVGGPLVPELSAAIEGGSVRLSWSNGAGDLPVKHYEVLSEGVVVDRVNAESLLLAIGWVGARQFAVRSVDTAGSVSNLAVATVVVNPPSQPLVAADFEGRDLVLSWSCEAGSLPVSYFDISDGGVVVAQVDATVFTLPVNWGASKTFGVTAVDIAGNRGVESAVVVGVEPPALLDVGYVFEAGRVVFLIDVGAGSLPVDRVEVFDGAVLLASVAADGWSLEVAWQGSREFSFRAVDAVGNVSGVVVVPVSPGLPLSPDIVGAFVDRNIRLAWPVGAGDLPVAYYAVQNGVELSRVTQPNFVAEVGWVGAREISVTPYDTAGNAGAVGRYTVAPVSPSSASIVSEVIDNNVLFRYGANAGSLPVDRYELKRGAELDSAVPFAVKAGNSTFTTLFESAAGIYTYWLVPVDTAGNEGDAVSTVATVSQPPDYVLFAYFSEREQGWEGTFSDAVLTQDNTMLAPVDVSETWQDYVGNGYATLQAEVDAGFNVFALPGPSVGSYEKVIDYGALLVGSLITVSASPDLVSGTLGASVILSYSIDGSTWTDGDVNQLQVYGSNFRYVKVRGEFSGDGDDLVEIQDIQVRLDRKLRSDAGGGVANASDSAGTRVYFSTPFIDVTSIIVSPRGVQSIVPVYDFSDTPNPEYFDVYLFNSNGGRVSGDFSWSASGY